MLNKEQKAGIAILLATIDDNLSITSYRLPQVNNSKIYSIKSSDGEIDISVSSIQLEDLSEKLDEIIDYVIANNDFSVEENDDEYEYIANVFNGYVDKFTEEYAEYYPEDSCEEMEGASYKRTEKFLNELSDLRDCANITTNEDKIFAIAYGLCVSVCDILEEVSGEDIEDDIAVSEALQERDVETLRSEYNLDWYNKKSVPNGRLEKTDLERIKLMLVASISPDIYLEMTARDNLENINTCLFYGIEKSGEPYPVYLHNKDSHKIESEILKIKLYNEITNAFDLGQFEDTDLQEKEVFSILKEDLQRFTDNYFYDRHLTTINEMINTTFESNFGRERLLMETFTTTLAGLIMELNNGLVSVNSEEFSCEYLEDVIKRNYEILKRDNTIFPQFAKLINLITKYRQIIRFKLENNTQIDEEFLSELEENKLSLKNALKDLIGVDSIPSNFDDLVTINEDTISSPVDYYDELDEMLDEELEREDVEYFDITSDDDFEDDKEI